MELRHLRYFVVVAETGHMTRAAALLGIQQPPLSLQIRALETMLGAALFTRHPKGVSLTDAGRLLYDEARRILADVGELEARMARVASGLVGTLSVGFTSSAAAHAFTPEALRECRALYPDIEILLSEHNAAEITEAVAARKLHCGFLRVPVAYPSGIVFETLLTEPVVLAVPIDHCLARGPAAGRVPVTPRDLHDENLILVRRPGAPGLYANLLALCEASGVRPRVVAEVERMMTSLNLVAAGAGITVVPASMQGAHPHAIAYRPFRGEGRLEAPITLVRREGESHPAVATFAKLAHSIARRWRAAHPVRGRSGSGGK